jgi:hypothetical protein
MYADAPVFFSLPAFFLRETAKHDPGRQAVVLLRNLEHVFASQPGNSLSRMMRSGLSFRTRRKASSPSLASTTPKPASVGTRLHAVLKYLLSSTRRIFAVLGYIQIVALPAPCKNCYTEKPSDILTHRHSTTVPSRLLQSCTKGDFRPLRGSCDHQQLGPEAESG